MNIWYVSNIYFFIFQVQYINQMLVQLSSDAHYLTCKYLDNFLFLAEKPTNFCFFAPSPFFVIEISSPVTCQLIFTYAFFTGCCYFYYYSVWDADVFFIVLLCCHLRFLMELCYDRSYLLTFHVRITYYRHVRELVFNISLYIISSRMILECVLQTFVALIPIPSFTFLGSYHHEESPGYAYLDEHKEQDSLLTYILYYVLIHILRGSLCLKY